MYAQPCTFFWPILLGAGWCLLGLKINPWVWFFPRHPGLSAYRAFLPWASGVGWHWRMLLPPSCPESVTLLPTENLGVFSLLISLGSDVPVRIYWTASYLEILQWVRGVLCFRIKDEEKRFPVASSPLPRTHPPCTSWSVAEISTLVGSRVPPRRNSPGGIYPRFCWSCQCSSFTSAYALSVNCSWTHCTRCNPRDNACLCTP